MILKYSICLLFFFQNALAIQKDRSPYVTPRRGVFTKITQPNQPKIVSPKKETSNFRVEHIPAYAQFEKQLRALVANAQNYHQAEKLLKEKIQENKFLPADEKREFYNHFEAELDKKFFPKRIPAQ